MHKVAEVVLRCFMPVMMVEDKPCERSGTRRARRHHDLEIITNWSYLFPDPNYISL